VKAKPKRRRLRAITHRAPRFDKRMDALATSMLEKAHELYEQSGDLDTTVRHSLAKGLAYIVHAAYDTQAIAQCVSDFDSAGYIQQKVYEWFRQREYVEWFCVGASTLFSTTPRMYFRFKTTQKKGAVKIERIPLPNPKAV
jgi:hypothetical protein